MKIGIAGLGSSGSFLLRLLSSRGYDVTGFDPKPEGFYIPCGYATNENAIRPLLSKVNLDFNEYVLSLAEKIVFSGEHTNEIEFNSAGLCTFDKNRLEADLIQGLNWNRSILKGEFDLIVDATGISRTFLPEMQDFKMHTLEYLSEGNLGNRFSFRYFSKGTGYFWVFPLGSKYHIGAGSDSRDQLRTSLAGYKHLKSVARDIRLKPLFSSAFTKNIIGIGESIGTVSPITGEGIVPSMKSALILFDTLTRYESVEEIGNHYVESIQKEFRRYERLFKLLSEVRDGRTLSFKNALSISAVKQDLLHFGIDFKLSNTIKTLLGSRSTK